MKHFNMTRDESQQKFINLWTNNNYHGSLAALTSYGKTRTAIKAIQQSNSKSTIIIVPQINLKQQWLKELKEWKIKNCEVYVVNSAAKLELNCDLLILDEAHTVGMADWFSLSWKQAKFDKLLALSATIYRKDKKHIELLKKAPVLMTVTFDEALKNKWVANYKIFNIALEFTKEEKIKYQNIEDKLEKIYKDVAEKTKTDLEYVRKNIFKLAKKFISNKENKELLVIGINYNRLINMRKNLLYNAESKKAQTLWFLKESKLNKKQTIIFSQTQEFADYIYNEFPSETEVIHSGMKDKDRELALKRFNDGRTKKRILSTIKAFNQGINIPILEVGINAAYTSSTIESTQKLGRICRIYGDKEAIFINLYIKNTQEVFWLKNSQYHLPKDKIKFVKLK